MIITMTRRTRTRTTQTTRIARSTIRTTNMTKIAQLWDLIETSSFREDIKGIKDIKYNDNDYKNIAV